MPLLLLLNTASKTGSCTSYKLNYTLGHSRCLCIFRADHTLPGLLACWFWNKKWASGAGMWTFPLHWELGSISFTEVSRFESQPHERVLLSLCRPRDSLANNPKQKPTSHNKDTICRMCMWDLRSWMVLGMSCKIPADSGLNLALDTWNCCVETFEGKCWWFQRNFHYRWDVGTLSNAVTNARVATSLHSALELHKSFFSADYV